MGWTDNLAMFLGTFIVWGFLMAFLFNVGMKFINEEQDNFLVYCSFILFVSYFFSDHFYTLFDEKEIYLTWFYYDLVTLAAIIVPAFFIKSKIKSPIYYLYTCLTINSFLFLGMHIDIVVNQNVTPWWFWDIYSIGMNIFDFTMIFALIFGFDYLGLVKLTRSTKNRVALKWQQVKQA